jgi:hypothetical protein
VAFARLAADVENIGYDVLDLNSFPKNPKNPSGEEAAIRELRTLLGTAILVELRSSAPFLQ